MVLGVKTSNLSCGLTVSVCMPKFLSHPFRPTNLCILCEIQTPSMISKTQGSPIARLGQDACIIYSVLVRRSGYPDQFTHISIHLLIGLVKENASMPGLRIHKKLHLFLVKKKKIHYTFLKPNNHRSLINCVQSQSPKQQLGLTLGSSILECTSSKYIM